MLHKHCSDWSAYRIISRYIGVATTCHTSGESQFVCSLQLLEWCYIVQSVLPNEDDFLEMHCMIIICIRLDGHTCFTNFCHCCSNCITCIFLKKAPMCKHIVTIAATPVLYNLLEVIFLKTPLKMIVECLWDTVCFCSNSVIAWTNVLVCFTFVFPSVCFIWKLARLVRSLEPLLVDASDCTRKLENHLPFSSTCDHHSPPNVK